MNIEQLAIEHGASKNKHLPCSPIRYAFTRPQLEAFAKAYARQSEPVGHVYIEQHDNGGFNTYTSLYGDLPDGTKLYTKPPLTVSLEQYNKLLDAIKEIYYRNLLAYGYAYEDKDRVNALFEKAIAEAERSAK